MAALLLGTITAVPASSRADNPIIQTQYTADPAPMVHEGTLYLYTTHDEDNTLNNFFTMNDWRVFSSTDAVNWTDHGSPLHYRDFSWASGDAWAPQAIHRNGKFYLYVPITRMGGGHAIGVAISDSPIGPFEDALGAPLITSNCGDIDPSVFIDDDGTAYLYWGNPNLCYVKLNEDMVSYQGDVVQVPLTTQSFGARSDGERPTSYEEGPWFYKREGRYYMVFAAGPISEHIGYATSDTPTGPWSYGGTVMPTEGGSFTNHPGVVDYKGKSLFFYHNAALPGGGGFKRSVSVEEFSYGADGSIPTLHMTTEGPTAVDTLNAFARIEAETIAWESGIETEVCSEGGMNVTSIDSGDYIKVKEVEFGSGATSFDARVASAAAGGVIELRLDGENGMLIGTCQVDSTGGENTWTTQSCSVSNATGKHDLFLKFTGGGFKFNWWQFSGPGDPGSEGAAGAGGTGGVGTASSTGTTGVGGISSSGGMSSSTTMAGEVSSAATGTASVSSSSTTGGTTTSAGVTGAGGTGALSTTSGASNTTAGLSPPPNPPTESGCTCQVVGGDTSGSVGPVGLLGLLGLCAARRRAFTALGTTAEELNGFRVKEGSKCVAS